MTTFLEGISADRRRRVEQAKILVPEAVLQTRRTPGATSRPYDRLAGWPVGQRAVIAEIKRRSPSKGPLRPGLVPGDLARRYAEAGALAISVLTEPDHFGGSLEDLDAVRAAVDVPVLYKDFVVDPYQLWEAWAHGADLVLLIAALLGESTGEYVAAARQIGLEPLVEVHDAPELDIALASGARLVGVNNRNLKTFRTDLAVSRELLPRIPQGILAIAESGMKTVQDLDDLSSAGARAFLIGEALVTAPDPGVALADLVRREVQA